MILLKFFLNHSIPVSPSSEGTSSPLSLIIKYSVPFIILSILLFNLHNVLYTSGCINVPPKSIYAYIPARSALVIPNISLESNPSSVGVGPLKNTGLDTSLSEFTLTNLSISKREVLKCCVLASEK